jgi:hypothetical protein
VAGDTGTDWAALAERVPDHWSIDVVTDDDHVCSVRGQDDGAQALAELIAAAPRLIAALLAERDADVSAGAVARTVAMSHIAAERDAERVARERAEAEARQLRELLHDVWLYIDWRYVTKQLTTEQKGMFADAVDEHTDGGYHAADRWWPAVAEGGEDAEDTE